MRLGNPDFTGDLIHWNHNTFRVKLRYRFYDEAFDQYVTFDLDATGKPMELRFYDLPARFLARGAGRRRQPLMLISAGALQGVLRGLPFPGSAPVHRKW